LAGITLGAGVDGFESKTFTTGSLETLGAGAADAEVFSTKRVAKEVRASI
jgi:hypothetical protein